MFPKLKQLQSGIATHLTEIVIIKIAIVIVYPKNIGQLFGLQSITLQLVKTNHHKTLTFLISIKKSI